MCLVTDNPKPLISEKQFTCYKIVGLVKDENGQITTFTPYMHVTLCKSFPYEGMEITPSVCDDREMQESDVHDLNIIRVDFNIGFPTSARPESPMASRNSRQYLVDGGWIHAYSSFPPKCESDSFFLVVNCEKFTAAVLECMIPKGAEYYVGVNDEICASSMTVKRILGISGKEAHSFDELMAAVSEIYT